jgi:hypothetical protein
MEIYKSDLCKRRETLASQKQKTNLKAVSSKDVSASISSTPRQRGKASATPAGTSARPPLQPTVEDANDESEEADDHGDSGFVVKFPRVSANARSNQDKADESEESEMSDDTDDTFHPDDSISNVNINAKPPTTIPEANFINRQSDGPSRKPSRSRNTIPNSSKKGKESDYVIPDFSGPDLENIVKDAKGIKFDFDDINSE